MVILIYCYPYLSLSRFCLVLCNFFEENVGMIIKASNISHFLAKQLLNCLLFFGICSFFSKVLTVK